MIASNYREYLQNEFNIDSKVIDKIKDAEIALSKRFSETDDITAVCQLKVIFGIFRVIID